MTNISNYYYNRTAWTKDISAQVISVKVHIDVPSMNSDLEAFSHNSTNDTFVALAVQPTALPNI